MKAILGDFFNTESHDGEKFDLIYDYTFLCALLPSMRVDCARRVSELLAPGGILVCLEFPLYKDVDAQGPPWGLKGVYWDLLAEGGNGIVGEHRGKEEEGVTGKGRGGSGVHMRRMLHYQPERTFEVGKGTDMISVWSNEV